MATAAMPTRPPLPPFTRETAVQKVRLAEDGWNTRDPGKVALAYAVYSRWRNRSEFINGRNKIVAFLARKWNSRDISSMRFGLRGLQTLGSSRIGRKERQNDGNAQGN